MIPRFNTALLMQRSWHHDDFFRPCWFVFFQSFPPGPDLEQVVVKTGGRRAKVTRSLTIARQREVRDFMAKVAYLDMGERSEASLPCV